MGKMEVRRGRQTTRNQESFYRLSPQQLKTPSPKQVFKAGPPLEATLGHVGAGPTVASPFPHPVSSYLTCSAYKTSPVNLKNCFKLLCNFSAL